MPLTSAAYAVAHQSAAAVEQAQPIFTRARQLALIVPTLHEAGNVQALINRIRAALDPLDIHYEVIVVDDNSRDGIQSIVEELSAEDPRIRMVTRIHERGLAGAIVHGWRYSSADVLGVIDADLQHPPELLPQLWQQMSRGADVAVASRYACGGCTGKWNASRRLVSMAAIWATLPLQKRAIRAKDPMSGFFLMRRSCIENLKLQTGGYKLLLEILVSGDVKSLAEVPFEFGLRNAGRSKANLKVAANYLKLLLRLYRERYFMKSTAAIATSAIQP